MPRFGTYEGGDPDYEVWRSGRTSPTTTAPTPVQPTDIFTDTGSTGTGNPSAPSDPTTGGDGSGTGALSPQIAPAVVIGLDLQRDNLTASEEEPAPAPTLEALSKDRRKRSVYTEIKRTNAPRTSGINL